MIKLKKTVAVLSLAATAVISLCAVTHDTFIFYAPMVLAKSQGESVCEEQIGGKTYVVARATVKATPEKVFSILSDYDHAEKVFPQVKHCKLVADRGASKVISHEIAPSGMPGTYEYILEVKESAPSALEWHRLSGDFKQVEGYWKLEPTDGGHSTNVTYASYVDGGLFIPQMLIRRQCKIDMAGVMNSLKITAETGSSVQIAGRPAHPNDHVQ